MHEDLIDFKTTCVDLIDDTWRASAHPDPEQLDLFRRGELTEEHVEALREHLLGCRECMERWRSAESSETPAGTLDFERAAFWRVLKPHLRGIEGAPTQPPRLVPGRWRHIERFSSWLAAACLVAVAGLSFWLSKEQQENLRPQANAPIYDLDAAFEPRTGGLSKPLTVPAAVGFTLLITPDRGSAEPVCELGFVDAAGREAHTVSGLVPHPVDGTFSLWLPAGALKEGEYRLELRAVAGRQPLLLETYVLQVSKDP